MKQVSEPVSSRPNMLALVALACLVLSAQAAAPHTNYTQLVIDEFTLYNPAYPTKTATAEALLHNYEKRLFALQAQGRSIPCSEQVLVECKQLVLRTAWFEQADACFKRLESSLQVQNQSFALGQQKADGAWGSACMTYWPAIVSTTITELGNLQSLGQVPRYPVKILARVGSPELVTEWFKAHMVSNLSATGYFARDDTGALVGSLTQLVYKSYLREYWNANVSAGFLIDDAYVQAYTTMLDAWQRADTGMWGQGIATAAGPTVWTPDISFTYHIVAYRQGNVSFLERAVSTVLAVRNDTYPFGWLHDGRSNAHNDYDICKLVRYGVKQHVVVVTPELRDTIGSMLRSVVEQQLSTTPPLQACDPTFYDSMGSCAYMVSSMMYETGYCASSMRSWWWDASTPWPWSTTTAHTQCCTLRQFITTSAWHASPSASAALSRLTTLCPSC